MSNIVVFKPKAPRAYVLELWEDGPRKITSIMLEGKDIQSASEEADRIITSQYPEQDLYLVASV